MNEFIKNLKLAGGEILEKIPKGWHQVTAEFGISENGSVYIKEYNKELFLSEFVVVILDKNKIYDRMTDVMDQVETGIFVSGPSKTADVESFLVLGAHGPMRLGVYFV